MDGGGYPEVRARTAERLDGWKSIAAYLKRDRTTVIRWARERGLPVHRVPGGQTGTVYALKHEVDRWLGMPGAADSADSSAIATVAELASAALPAPVAAAATAPAAKRPGLRWIVGIAGVLLVIGVPAVLATQGPRPAAPGGTGQQALPADAVTSARFLEARDLVAGRTSDGLERAIGLLEQVVRAAPDYAPGHATLAQAYVLSREFGMRGDAEAFSAARIAARDAVRLAPDMAAGHRMLGFIAYWADRDFASSDAHFRRALALDPQDSLSHFWHGNVLADHGDHAAALKALDQARLLQPGSVAIATDLAWAQWSAGRDAVAKAGLAAVVRDHPDFAIAHDCLANIALADGDFADYAHHFARYAALKQNSRLIAEAHAVEAAMRHGIPAAKAEILRQALAAAAQDSRRSHAWPALVASVAGDRSQLKAVLEDAARHGAQWGDAGIMLRLELAWRDDPEIADLLQRLSSPPPATEATRSLASASPPSSKRAAHSHRRPLPSTRVSRKGRHNHLRLHLLTIL